MPSERRLTFLKKMIILGPKTAILGPHFCRILVLGPHFSWSGEGPGPWIHPWDNSHIKQNHHSNLLNYQARRTRKKILFSQVDLCVNKDFYNEKKNHDAAATY